MENTGTVSRWQTAPSPRSSNHGRGQPQEKVLPGRMGEESGHQRQCYNCGKSVHLAKFCRVGKITCWRCGGGGCTRNVCPSKIKLQQKQTKRTREKLYSYKLLTSIIQPYNLFYFY